MGLTNAEVAELEAREIKRHQDREDYLEALSYDYEQCSPEQSLASFREKNPLMFDPSRGLRQDEHLTTDPRCFGRGDAPDTWREPERDVHLPSVVGL